MLAALRRQRRAPATAVRAAVAERRDRRRGRIPPPPPIRREVRSLVAIPSGPGRWPWLADSIEALRASDGDDSHILVVDDSTLDTRESVVRARFPEVEVIRHPVPTGGPPSTWPVYRRALLWALERYDFEQFVKVDSDSLVTAPGFSARTLEVMASTPRAGLGGSHSIRCDGVPEDRGYHARVLGREVRRDATLRAAARRAAANGWEVGDIVQGAVHCLTRAAAEALAAAGWLDWRRPWHSQTSDDLVISMFVAACGFELVSLGHPGSLFAVGAKRLPLPLEELGSGRWLVVHSTKCGLYGEDEAEVRTYLRARRADWADPGGAQDHASSMGTSPAHGEPPNT